METVKYNIDGLVEVFIDGNVRPEIIREVDFQIGYFKMNIDSGNDLLPKICMHPYDCFSEVEDLEKGTIEFYTSNGVPGIILCEPKNRLCVLRESNQFTIYADYPNFLINLYIQFLIVPNGFSMIHAGGYVDSKGNATLVTGAGGIGKTAIIGHAVKDLGLTHLGDDIVIMGDDGTCLPFPRAFVLKKYHREMYSETFKRMKLPRMNLYTIKRFIVENAPFVGVGKSLLRSTGLYYTVADMIRPIPHLATVTTDEIFGPNSVANKGTLGNLLYLDRSGHVDFSIKTISQTEMVNRIFSVIHYEWKDFATHFLSLGAINVVDLKVYFLQVIENLTKSAGTAKLLYIQVPKNASPESLVEFLEKNDLF